MRLETVSTAWRRDTDGLSMTTSDSGTRPSTYERPSASGTAQAPDAQLTRRLGAARSRSSAFTWVSSVEARALSPGSAGVFRGMDTGLSSLRVHGQTPETSSTGRANAGKSRSG